MKKSFIEDMTWLHTWSGLVFGWALFSIFLTGTLCVFWMEISVWARPDVHALHMPDRAALTHWSLDYLHKNAPEAKRWSISLPEPNARDPALVLTFPDRNGKTQSRSFVPDGSGRLLRSNETHGGRFFVDFHWTLNLPPPYVPDGTKTSLPFMFVGAAALAFLINTITGVVIHKKIFQDFFTFRPRAKSRQRSWLDAHNVLGVLPWIFHVLIVATGLAYLSFDYLPAASTILNGDRLMGINYLAPAKPSMIPARGTATPSPPSAAGDPIIEAVKRVEAQFGSRGSSSVSIRNPGGGGPVVVDITRSREAQITGADRLRMNLDGQTFHASASPAPVRSTWETLTALHFAFFGGTAMRLLYFLCGAAGTAMTACGLLLFTVKRREKAHSPAAERFYRIVDRINVAAIAGPMLACIGYLWAVRLLPYSFPASKFFYRFSTLRFTPLDQASRLDWEIYTFWLIWGAAMVHAALRAPRAAWAEQLGATSLLCLGLPVLGYVAPNSGLFAMMAAGDWKTAGVDLTALALGLGFAWAAWKVSGKAFAKLMTPAPSPSAAE